MQFYLVNLAPCGEFSFSYGRNAITLYILGPYGRKQIFFKQTHDGPREQRLKGCPICLTVTLLRQLSSAPSRWSPNEMAEGKSSWSGILSGKDAPALCRVLIAPGKGDERPTSHISSHWKLTRSLRHTGTGLQKDKSQPRFRKMSVRSHHMVGKSTEKGTLERKQKRRGPNNDGGNRREGRRDGWKALVKFWSGLAEDQVKACVPVETPAAGWWSVSQRAPKLEFCSNYLMKS